MRRDATRSRQKAAASSPPTVRSLLQDIAEGIRMFRTRDGIDLSNEQILERARNIVTGLLGELPDPACSTRATLGSRACQSARWTCSISSNGGPKPGTTGAPVAPDGRLKKFRQPVDLLSRRSRQ